MLKEDGMAGRSAVSVRAREVGAKVAVGQEVQAQPESGLWETSTPPAAPVHLPWSRRVGGGGARGRLHFCSQKAVKLQSLKVHLFIFSRWVYAYGCVHVNVTSLVWRGGLVSLEMDFPSAGAGEQTASLCEQPAHLLLARPLPFVLFPACLF